MLQNIQQVIKQNTYKSSPVLLSSSSSNEVKRSDESCNFWPVLTTFERRVTIRKISSSGIPFSSSIKSHNRLQTLLLNKCLTIFSFVDRFTKSRRSLGGVWGKGPSSGAGENFFGCFLDMKEFFNKSM